MERFEAYDEALKEFVNSRGWNAFQSPKDLAMAMAVESAEVLEIFQWLTPQQSLSLREMPERKRAVAHELADVLNYLMRLAWAMDIDILDAAREKLEINVRRFPTPEQ